jgi:aldehyde reductase
MLTSGYPMPMVGYGTFRAAPGMVKAAVLEALRGGYRHLDLAHVYGNEKEIGEGLSEAFSSGLVKREDLFLTGKLWNSDHEVAVVPEAYKKSCSDLGVDYLDLYLIHFPLAVKHTGLDNAACSNVELGSTPLIDTWRAMEALVDAGKVRSIGVSNYPLMLLHDLYNQARIKPAVNQIEIHPFYVRNSLVNYCLSRKIAVTAHTPLGGGQANVEQWAAASPMETEEVKKIAKEKGKSAGQVLLRWLLQRDIIVIPKSVKTARIEQNIDVFDFELSEQEMQTISGLDRYKSAKTNPNPLSHFIGGPDCFSSEGTDIFD